MKNINNNILIKRYIFKPCIVIVSLNSSSFAEHVIFNDSPSLLGYTISVLL